jgi:hypothetical protein
LLAYPHHQEISMSKPKLLDLACKAGGASEGYYRAGFDVTGVDIEPQPNYPGHMVFIQADMFEYLPAHAFEFDVISASPMCEVYSLGTQRWLNSGHRDYKDQIAPLRPLLAATGKPWIIENVERAPLRKDVMLCGTMFGLKLLRHRVFESNVALFGPGAPCHHFGNIKHNKNYVTVAGHGGEGSNRLSDWQEAMGIYWMSKIELSKAIPPAYTEWLGLQLMEYLRLD